MPRVDKGWSDLNGTWNIVCWSRGGAGQGRQRRQCGPALSLKGHCHKRAHPVAKPTAGLKRDD